MTWSYFDLYLKNITLYEILCNWIFNSLGPKEEFDMYYNFIEACWLF